MKKSVNPGNNSEQSLNSCNEKSAFQEPVNIDTPPSYCPPDIPKESQNDIADRHEFFGLIEDNEKTKVGIGRSALCDPMQTGQLINDPADGPNRNTIYRYSKGLRGCDEATTDLFRNIVVIDENGKSHPVPIMWASQERAVAHIMQDNIRKDDSLVIDRVRLPFLAIYSSSIEFNQGRYTYHKALDYGRSMTPDMTPGYTASERYEKDTVFGVARGIPVDIGYSLYVWSLYIEDMNQIIEQIITKFSPMAYIRVRGVNWEVGVKLNSIANNLTVEPGDKKARIVKYQFNLTSETYIPQPIVRKKAVLKTKTNFFNNLNEENVTMVIDRLEDAVRELE